MLSGCLQMWTNPLKTKTKKMQMKAVYDIFKPPQDPSAYGR